MSYKLEKPYTDIEGADFIVKYNHNSGLLIEETDTALYALEPNEIMIDGKPGIDPDYENKLTVKRFERLRMMRDKKLEKCDWAMSSDIPMAQEKLDAWKVYRQALRDLPQQDGAPWDGGGEATPWPINPKDAESNEGAGTSVELGTSEGN